MPRYRWKRSIRAVAPQAYNHGCVLSPGRSTPPPNSEKAQSGLQSITGITLLHMKQTYPKQIPQTMPKPHLPILVDKQPGHFQAGFPLPSNAQENNNLKTSRTISNKSPEKCVPPCLRTKAALKHKQLGQSNMQISNATGRVVRPPTHSQIPAKILTYPNSKLNKNSRR